MRPEPLLTTVLLALAACSTPDRQPAVAATEQSSAGAAIVAGTAPSGSIVALVPAGGEAPMPEGPAVMDQYAKRFVPDTLYVRVGQPVEFRNSEDMPHNVAVSRRGTGTQVFNVGTEPQQKYVHTFDRVGQFDVTCDIHPGMQATVIAVNSSLATIAGDDGRFAIANVPLGSYKISVVFEGRTVEQDLEVKGARTDATVTP